MRRRRASLKKGTFLQLARGGDGISYRLSFLAVDSHCELVAAEGDRRASEVRRAQLSVGKSTHGLDGVGVRGLDVVELGEVDFGGDCLTGFDCDEVLFVQAAV